MSPKPSTNESRLSQIVEELRFISDAESFASAVGDNSKTGSVVADEVFCTLFDDLDIEGYLKSPEGISDEATRLLEMTVSALNAVARETPTHIDGKRLLSNANWKRSQKLAEQFVFLVDEDQSK